jgi:prefoldin alpha subunit
MTKEEDIQQKYMQFQMLQQQMEEINQHLEMLNQNNAELEISINAIRELGKTEPGNEVLAPIANGIFIKTKLEDNQKLIVNVGSDSTVEKTPEQVIRMLEEQVTQIHERMNEAEMVTQELNNQAMKIFQDVEENVNG